LGSNSVLLQHPVIKPEHNINRSTNRSCGIKKVSILILQRHMVMNYPEYSNAVSRIRFPKLSIADASAGHNVLWPAELISIAISAGNYNNYFRGGAAGLG
jgi:hypothetical protein